jgi:hypothetical protein
MIARTRRDRLDVIPMMSQYDVETTMRRSAPSSERMSSPLASYYQPADQVKTAGMACATREAVSVAA